MLVTPKRRAVPGISCINPVAPLYETARELKPDSWRITAIIRFGSMPLRAAACLTYSSYLGLPVVSTMCWASLVCSVAAVDGITMGCVTTIAGVGLAVAFAVTGAFTAAVFASGAGLTVSLIKTSEGVRV